MGQFLQFLAGINWAVWVPVVVLLLGALGYLLKRRIEGASRKQRVSSLTDLLDFKVKLDSSGMSIDSLHSFEAKVLGKPAKVALGLARHYADVADTLSIDAERAEAAGDDASTQTELNENAASRHAEARLMLAATVATLASRTADGAEALKDAQNTWEAFQAAELQRERQKWGAGTVAPMMVAAKAEALALERRATLEQELASDEDNLLTFERSRTPRNLFDLVEPGVPRARVESLLGVPHSVSQVKSMGYEKSFYRFEDTQLEISYADGIADTVICLLVQDQACTLTLSGYGEITLGNLTLADVYVIDQQEAPRFFHSNRTQELAVLLRVGPGGAWDYFWVGATAVFSGAGQLQKTEFEWDAQTDHLITPPDRIVMNWVGKTNSSLDVPSFSWFIR